MSYGVHLAGSVGSTALAANAVTSAKITNATIATEDLAADAVTGAKIADDAINSEHLAAGSIDLAHMSVNSVDSDQYVDGSIDTAHLAADAVTGAKLADDSVDSEHLVNGSVDLVHMSVNSVDSDQYVDGSIDNDHLAGSIANAKLANSSVTVSDGSNTSPIALGGTLTFAGTANEVNVAESAGTITVGLPDNVTIAGNLTVSGTTTTVDSTTVTIADPIFELGSDSSDDNLDRGVLMKWHNGSAAKKAFMGYDDSTSKFTMIADATDTSSVISGTAGTLAMTTFEGALTGNASTATELETARTIGGTSFDGSANIAVALASTATALANARTINGVSFDGTANISLTAFACTDISSVGSGAIITSAERNLLGATPGQTSASTALIVDGSSAIAGIGQLSATNVIATQLVGGLNTSTGGLNVGTFMVQDTVDSATAAKTSDLCVYNMDGAFVLPEPSTTSGDPGVKGAVKFIRNSGASDLAVTVDGTGKTVGGTTSLTLPAGAAAIAVSDGSSNWMLF
jgi:hypothetical protein